MKRSICVALLILMTSIFALAHGKPQKIMGTVKEITPDHIVVSTIKGETHNVEIRGTTKFLKSGNPATEKDIEMGERVVIEADVHEGKLIALTVKFGKPPRTSVHYSIWSGRADHQHESIVRRSEHGYSTVHPGLLTMSSCLHRDNYSLSSEGWQPRRP